MEAHTGLAGASVERFRADLERLTGERPTPASPLGLAVSGGPDSFALLLLASAAYPGCVTAATVDHQLRPNSAAEASHVAKVCAELGVSHRTLRLEGKRAAQRTNLQDRARRIRYTCLARWATGQRLRFVGAAHQRDDVAESFLMGAARGGGVRSLAAMPDARLLDGSAALLIRPLLGWSRAELAEIAVAADPVADPSNTDVRFDRVRIRRWLADNRDLPPDRLARAATNLRDAEEALEWVMTGLLVDRIVEDDDGGCDVRVEGLPFELRRRLVLRAVEAVGGAAIAAPDGRPASVVALVKQLDRGRGGTVAGVQASVAGGQWHFCAAPPRRTG